MYSIDFPKLCYRVQQLSDQVRDPALFGNKRLRNQQSSSRNHYNNLLHLSSAIGEETPALANVHLMSRTQCASLLRDLRLFRRELDAIKITNALFDTVISKSLKVCSQLKDVHDVYGTVLSFVANSSYEMFEYASPIKEDPLHDLSIGTRRRLRPVIKELHDGVTTAPYFKPYETHGVLMHERPRPLNNILCNHTIGYAQQHVMIESFVDTILFTNARFQIKKQLYDKMESARAAHMLESTLHDGVNVPSCDTTWSSVKVRIRSLMKCLHIHGGNFPTFPSYTFCMFPLVPSALGHSRWIQCMSLLGFYVNPKDKLLTNGLDAIVSFNHCQYLINTDEPQCTLGRFEQLQTDEEFLLNTIRQTSVDTSASPIAPIVRFRSFLPLQRAAYLPYQLMPTFIQRLLSMLVTRVAT